METIIIFLVGFVVGILVGRKHTGVVESVVSFAKKLIGKK
tara:strand:- start:652 stop:771 length:120 start_codon:yes stop_codon:yes gene_type:complete